MDDNSAALSADQPALLPALTDLCCHYLAHHSELLFNAVIDDECNNLDFDSNSDTSALITPDLCTVMVSDNGMIHDYCLEAPESSLGDSFANGETVVLPASSVETIEECNDNAAADHTASSTYAYAVREPRSSRFGRRALRRLSFKQDALPPRGLAERLLDAVRCFCVTERRNDAPFLRAFADDRICLQHINLKSSDVTDQLLRQLLNAHGAQLVSLDLSSCERLTLKFNVYLSSLSSCAPKLVWLSLNGCTLRIFERWLQGCHSSVVEPIAQEAYPLSTLEWSLPISSHESANASANDIEPLTPPVVFDSFSASASTSAPPMGSSDGQFLACDNDNESKSASSATPGRRRAIKRRSPASDDDVIAERLALDRPFNGKIQSSGLTNGGGEMDEDHSSDVSPSSSKSGNVGSLNDEILAPCSSAHQKNLSRVPDLSLTMLKSNDEQASISRCDSLMLKNPIFTDICINLQYLILHGDELEHIWADEEVTDKERVVWEFFERLLHPLQRLAYLDISGWSNCNDLSFLEHRPLTTLILHDVPDLYKAVNVLCTLDSLEYLDLSQSKYDTGQYSNPVTTLTRLVTSLLKLRCLDISFTNLALNPRKGDLPKHTEHLVESDIYGLQGLKRKLDYLGIFCCDAASYFHRIPALSVAGDATEPQLLVAAERYAHRPRLLLSVLNEMFQTYKFGGGGAAGGDKARALHLLLDAMYEHDANVNVQIASSASLFYVLRGVKMNFATKDRVINLLLNAMDNHISEQTLVRNCCLSLHQFDIAVEMAHIYVDAFRVLLKIMREYADTMIQRLVVHILNSLACSGQGDQKVAVGRLGAFNILLDLIKQRLEALVCDDVLKMAWSFMWNITDETPLNCQLFLDAGGMDLFKKCYAVCDFKMFPNESDLMRNMMGLVGNIAEVKELRRELMNTDYITIFLDLLHNLSDGIEISYNSAGVLAHLLSDGKSAWTVPLPEREKTSAEVIKAVKSWQLTSRRYINYKSFEPILKLLIGNSSDASRYWAVWALANLTTVDGAKYCKFVIDEDGINILTKATSHTDAGFRDLVTIVLRNVAAYVKAMIDSPCKQAADADFVLSA